MRIKIKEEWSRMVIVEETISSKPPFHNVTEPNNMGNDEKEKEEVLMHD